MEISKFLKTFCQKRAISVRYDGKIYLFPPCPSTTFSLIIYIKILLDSDWLISVQLISNSRAIFCNHRAIFCNLITVQKSVTNLYDRWKNIVMIKSVLRIGSAHNNVRTSNVNIAQISNVSNFLNINSFSYSFTSIENQNGVRYSDSTSYFKKYSSSKCKQTVCLHYGLDFPFKEVTVTDCFKTKQTWRRAT